MSSYRNNNNENITSNIIQISDNAHEVFWLRKGDKILYVNPAFERLFGIPVRRFYENVFAMMKVVYDEDYARVYNIIEKDGAHMKTCYNIEFRIIRPDGLIRWLWLKTFFIDEANGDIEKKAAIVIDITERKQMEEELLKMKEIEAKNRDLERACQMESLKMEFFANVSHEFRTPLNIILSALQLILYSMPNHEELPEICRRHYRHLRSIKQNAFRLLRLVNNLIDITKLDSGYLKLYPMNHNIVKIIEDVTRSVDQYIAGKEITLGFNSDAEEVIIACDADLIERIMLNLLSNAVKYTDKGGRIEVSVNNLGNRVKVSVKDSGVGIPKEKLASIFERFAQADRPLSRRCEGSGIGLSLVKSLVELHKGCIYAESEVNEGSRFTFELPVVILDQSAGFKAMEPSKEERIHKINVEFSDIYSLDT